MSDDKRREEIIAELNWVSKGCNYVALVDDAADWILRLEREAAELREQKRTLSNDLSAEQAQNNIYWANARGRARIAELETENARLHGENLTLGVMAGAQAFVRGTKKQRIAENARLRVAFEVWHDSAGSVHTLPGLLYGAIKGDGT